MFQAGELGLEDAQHNGNGTKARWLRRGVERGHRGASGSAGPGGAMPGAKLGASDLRHQLFRAILQRPHSGVLDP